MTEPPPHAPLELGVRALRLGHPPGNRRKAQMMTPDSNRHLPLLIFLEGIGLAILVVWLGERLVGMDWSAEERVPRLVRTVLAALPFLFVSVAARDRFRAGGPTAEAEVLGAVALVTAGYLVLWGWYLLEALRHAPGGANIGMGILMMFSPFLLAALIPAGHWLGRRWARPGR